jgi:hypothetical protein
MPGDENETPPKSAPKRTFVPPKRQPPQRGNGGEQPQAQQNGGKGFSQWLVEDAEDDFD